NPESISTRAARGSWLTSSQTSPAMPTCQARPATRTMRTASPSMKSSKSVGTEAVHVPSKRALSSPQSRLPHLMTAWPSAATDVPRSEQHIPRHAERGHDEPRQVHEVGIQPCRLRVVLEEENVIHVVQD